MFCRRGSRVAPAPLDSASKVQAAVQARQHKEAQMALDRRTLASSNASTSGQILLKALDRSRLGPAVSVQAGKQSMCCHSLRQLCFKKVVLVSTAVINYVLLLAEALDD